MKVGGRRNDIIAGRALLLGRLLETLVDSSCLRLASEAGVIKFGKRSGLDPEAGWVKAASGKRDS